MGGLCGGGSKTTTSKTSSPLDKYTQSAAEMALKRAMDISNQSYIGYNPEKRVAPFSKDQQSAFQGIRNFDSSVPEAYRRSNSWIGSYGNAPQSHVGAGNTNVGQTRAGSTTAGTTQAGQVANAGRLVDQNGRLGKISDYMNPYLDAALKPAIRDTQEAGMKQRMGIGAQAQSAGAFGDARHGVVEGEQMRGEQRNIGDMSAEARSNAFASAMGLRSDDLNRQIGVDTANVDRRFASDVGNVDRRFTSDVGNVNRELQSDTANVDRRFASDTGNVDRQFAASQGNAALREQMLGRQLGAANAGMQNAQAYDSSQIGKLLTLMGSGEKQQAHQQGTYDARYNEFLQAREWPNRGLDTLLGFLNGRPTAQTVTQTQPGENPLMKLIGSAAGSYLGGG